MKRRELLRNLLAGAIAAPVAVATVREAKAEPVAVEPGPESPSVWNADHPGNFREAVTVTDCELRRKPLNSVEYAIRAGECIMPGDLLGIDDTGRAAIWRADKNVLPPTFEAQHAAFPDELVTVKRWLP